MNHLKVVARHFSDDRKTQLVFQDEACPSTDGKRIILPTQVNPKYSDNVIGSLLHETSHIKHTTLNAMSGLSKSQSNCLNVLEDIRVDHLTKLEYPNSVYFYKKLVEECIETKHDRLNAEPIPVRILKSLIFTAHGFEPLSIYDSDIVARLQKYLGYINIAKNAKDTDELVEHAIELAKELFGELDLPDDKDGDGSGEGKDGDKSDDKNGEADGQSQSGDGDSGDTDEDTDGDGDDSGFDTDADGDSKSGQGKAKAKNKKPSSIQKELDEIRDEIKKLDEEQSNTQKEYNEHAKEENKSYRNRKANRRKQNNAKTDEERDKYQKLVAKHHELQKQAVEKCHDARRESNEIRDKMSMAYHKKNELLNELEAIEHNGFAFGKDTEISGFNALDADKCKMPNNIKLESTQTLDEVIAETVIARRDKKFEDDNGANLNVRQYGSLYTDVDKLFLDEEKQEYKTKVALVLDASSSTGQVDVEGSRAHIIFELSKIIVNAIDKANKSGAPVEFLVYGFTSKVVELCNSENFTDELLYSGYSTFRYHYQDGTNLADAVNLVADKMREDEDSNCDLVAIVITDACVYDDEMKALANQTCSHNVKFGFVAVHPSSYDRSDAFSFLFGENIIECGDDEATSLEKLTNIMLGLDGD